MFAISYDPVPVLAAFSAQHGITYPLLSDEGSRVIRALGLEDVRYADRPADDHHRGVPYPGTFFLDEEGTVVDQRFEQHHRWRPSAPSLFEDLVHRPGRVAVSGTAAGPGLRAAAWLAEADYRPQEIGRVHVRLEIDAGSHVYVAPIPPGYVELAVDLEPIGSMTTTAARLPAGRPFRLAGLDEQFCVLTGSIDTQLEFRIESGRGPVELVVRIRYQACDDEVCFMPTTVRIPLPITEGTAFSRTD